MDEISLKELEEFSDEQANIAGGVIILTIFGVVYIGTQMHRYITNRKLSKMQKTQLETVETVETPAS